MLKRRVEHFLGTKWKKKVLEGRSYTFFRPLNMSQTILQHFIYAYACELAMMYTAEVHVQSAPFSRKLEVVETYLR